tara:strand:+ start:325 stop:756 length:432 start_codon:yes stop_codon:yes gene_type:complete
VKKKSPVSYEDEKEWLKFLQDTEKLPDKDKSNIFENRDKKKTRKLDLHGFSLQAANEEVKKFIIESYENQYVKLLVILGKGTRSKVYENPYLSEKMNILKNSVPEYIKNNVDLSSKISKISKASIKDGGEGAIYIFLKKNKEL